MRGTFIKTLAELAEHDPRIVLITADLGFMAIEPFSTRFPDRFINAGVSEQNMIGLATGMAKSGYIPFAYSIVPFASLRTYEFIRNGPVLHQLPVRIVGVGAGFDYGTNGLTHYGLDDIGALRTQPGLTIISPADSQQTRTALHATYAQNGPIYYRLGKDDRIIIDGLNGQFDTRYPIKIRDGKDVMIACMGSISTEAIAVAQALELQYISATILVFSVISPADKTVISDMLRPYKLIVSIENHYAVGGLGSLICETVAQYGLASRVICKGVERLHDGITGSTAFLQARHGLNAAAIVPTIMDALTSQNTP